MPAAARIPKLVSLHSLRSSHLPAASQTAVSRLQRGRLQGTRLCSEIKSGIKERRSATHKGMQWGGLGREDSFQPGAQPCSRVTMWLGRAGALRPVSIPISVSKILLRTFSLHLRRIQAVFKVLLLVSSSCTQEAPRGPLRSVPLKSLGKKCCWIFILFYFSFIYFFMSFHHE